MASKDDVELGGYLVAPSKGSRSLKLIMYADGGKREVDTGWVVNDNNVIEFRHPEHGDRTRGVTLIRDMTSAEIGAVARAEKWAENDDRWEDNHYMHAGGYWLGPDAGDLFRGEIVDSYDDEGHDEARDLAKSLARYWAERDLEHEEDMRREDEEAEAEAEGAEERGPGIRLKFLPVNGAWVFMFGDQITDVDGQRLFPSKQKALDAAKRSGLKVSKSGVVTASERKLKTEINTTEMANRIWKAFAASDLYDGGFSVAFEHGQHWVTADNGAQWSVVDATGGAAIDGFDFEQVTEGDED